MFCSICKQAIKCKEVSEKSGNQHSGAENFMLTLMHKPTSHIGGRWCVSDLHVIVTDI